MATASVTRRPKSKKKPAEAPVVEVVSAVVETVPVTETVAPVEAAAPEPEREMPASLKARVDAVTEIYADLQKEIDAFKAGQAYLEGDVPITLRGLAGPGLHPGQRTLNWMSPSWLDSNKHYRWSNKVMVDYHRGDGYKPCDYDQFTKTVRARGGDHHFDRTPEGHVQSGDLILVETSKDWHAQLQARAKAKTDRRESRAKGGLHQAGEQFGVEVLEGRDASNPKLGRLLEYLEKELGPGVTDAYLGR